MAENAPDATSVSASDGDRRRVGIVLLPGFTLLTYSALIDVLRHDGATAEPPLGFECRVVGSGAVRSSCGIDVTPTHPIRDVADCDVVVVLGGREVAAVFGRGSIIDGLRAADGQGATLVGAGSGLFLLIEAGFFDSTPCATDWYGGQDRDLRFAGVEAIPGRDLVVAPRRVSCAGGVAALDLGRWLIDRHDTARSETETPTLAHSREVARDSETEEETCDPRVRRARSLIERHLARPMRVEAIAAAVGLSKRQLERLFHQEVGHSVQQYSRDVRVAFGLWLLVHTTKSITDVALEAGFSDSSHFNRLFRSAFGRVPSEMRRDGDAVAGALPDHWRSIFETVAHRERREMQGAPCGAIARLPILFADRREIESHHPR